MSEKGRNARKAYLERRKVKLSEAKQTEEMKPVEKKEKEAKIKIIPTGKSS